MPYAGAAGRGADLELVAADGNRFAPTAAVSPGSTGRGIVILPDVRPSATGLSGGRLSIQDQAPLTLVAVVGEYGEVEYAITRGSGSSISSQRRLVPADALRNT